ncbi:MAG: CBS domain-containing protein [Lapillicoccus sp.]
MLVEEIMTTDVVTVRDDASPSIAVRLLAERALTMLPVVDAEDRLVGVVTEADLLGLPVPADPRAHLRPARGTAPESGGSASSWPRTVADLATSSPETTVERADVSDVAQVFRRTAWKCLPVMRDDRLVGVISRSDIIRAMSRDDADVENDVNQLFRQLDPDWRATVSKGEASISGPGSDRDADAAASLATTVTGVRRVRVVERAAHDPEGATDAGLTSFAGLPRQWVCPPSSATGADQL